MRDELSLAVRMPRDHDALFVYNERSDVKSPLVADRTNPRLTSGGIDLRDYPKIIVAYRKADLAVKKKKAHLYCIECARALRLDHHGSGGTDCDERQQFLVAHRHDAARGDPRPRPPQHPPSLQNFGFNPKRVTGAQLEEMPLARGEIARLEQEQLDMISRADLSMRAFELYLTPLLLHACEWGRLHPQGKSWLNSPPPWLIGTRQTGGTKMRIMGEHDLQLLLEQYRPIGGALAADGVTIGHDKLYVIMLQNAMHPELDAVTIMIIHAFPGNRASFAEALKKALALCREAGVHVAGGSVDGLPVQGQAWNQDSQHYALIDSEFHAAFKTVLCGCHTGNIAVRDAAAIEPDIKDSVEGIRAGGLTLVKAPIQRLLGLVARHGSESRWANDQQEMTFAVRKLPQLEVLSAKLLDIARQKKQKIVSTADLQKLLAMFRGLPLYAAQVSVRVDGTLAMESNSTSMGDHLSVLYEEHLAAKELTTKIAAVYPEVTMASERVIHDCTTLRFRGDHGGDIRELGDLATALGRFHLRWKFARERHVEFLEAKPRLNRFRLTPDTTTAVDTLVAKVESVRAICANLEAAIAATDPLAPEPVEDDEQHLREEVDDAGAEALQALDDQLATIAAPNPTHAAIRSDDEDDDDAFVGPWGAPGLLDGLITEALRETRPGSLPPEAELPEVGGEGDALELLGDPKARRTAQRRLDIAKRELTLLAEQRHREKKAEANGDVKLEAINVPQLIENFELWLSDKLCDDVTSLFDGDSHAAIWNQFGKSYQRRGGGELAELMLELLSIPASEAQVERTIKHLRRVSRRCGPQLGPETELARLLRATCPSLDALRAAAE